jgi:hypothetical protein
MYTLLCIIIGYFKAEQGGIVFPRVLPVVFWDCLGLQHQFRLLEPATERATRE